MQFIEKWQMSFRYLMHRKSRGKKLMRWELDLFFDK